ncbi:MAG: rRNA maturation RNAse YbeY, partial [Desulfosalsimonas sp.]
MEVLITNRQNLYLLSEESIKSTAYALLEKLGKTGAELSLLIVDDEQIAQINKTYLGRTGPTNV